MPRHIVELIGPGGRVVATYGFEPVEPVTPDMLEMLPDAARKSAVRDGIVDARQAKGLTARVTVEKVN